MTDDINARKLGRRRLTTRRLMRHPARMLAESPLVSATAPSDPDPERSQQVEVHPASAAPPRDLLDKPIDLSVPRDDEEDRPTIEMALPAVSVQPTAAAPETKSHDAARPESLVANDQGADLDIEVDDSDSDSDDDDARAPRDSRAKHAADGNDGDVTVARAPLAAAAKVSDDAETIELTQPMIAAALKTSSQLAVLEESSPLARALLSADGSASDAGSESNGSRAKSTPPATAAESGAAVDAAIARSSNGDLDDRDPPEAKTKPKIRLPDGGVRRQSPRPEPRSTPPSAASTRPERTEPPDGERSSERPQRSSSVPPTGSGRGLSPFPPPPALPGALASSQLAAAATGYPTVPTGEGIIRSSLPPRGQDYARQDHGRNDRESDAPTRPRIPLTHDMALAAGRMSMESPLGGDDLSATRPRFAVPNLENTDSDAARTVVVSRARVISDRPPAPDDGEPERPIPRAPRRPRPDSEEFETLDLEDGVEEPSRLEISGSASSGRGGFDGSPRVSRTPPPPPAQQPSAASKRGSAAPTVQQRGAPPPPPPSVAGRKSGPQASAVTKSTGKKRAWWEVLFSDDYVRTLAKLSPALVTKQINFMESSLGIKRGDAVLDVGCGLGQHALEFARRGYLVVALDLALSMITRAAEDAQQHGLRINFLHKDIRDIGFEGTFDAVICVGTTFGFFDDEQNRSVLQRLAHALKPGGRLLLDVVNRDHVIASQPNLVWFEGEACVVMEESDFNFYSSRLNVKRTMMREDGRQTESEYSIRLYSVHELGQMLKQAGFSIKEVSGQEATRGLFFGAQSGRIIMLAERRAGGRSRDDSVPPGSEP